MLLKNFIKFLLPLKAILITAVATAQPRIINDSVTIAIEPDYNQVSGAHRILLGENYRKLWAVPVKLRVLHLKTEKGGLKIEEKGGGMQTKSLRLVDKTGQEWVLRSVQKYPERALPPKLRQGIAKAIIRDQTTTANPFASLTVPPLAEALGVHHSNPQIVYVADDPGLGKYRKDYKNSVYLFEEREPLESENTDNTKKVQKKLFEDNDVRVDQKLVLRARLLDMIIGDWDRHEDQWRWDKKKTDDETVYTPIPRDRDQVYYKTSGILPWFVSHQWLKAKFQPYKDKIRDINTWNLNARYFDRFFLNQLDAHDWHEQIAYVQSHLTDEVVKQAMHRMPANIYRLSGPELTKTLIARRNNIAKQAMEYYHFVAQYVDIPLSEKHERVDIEGVDSGRLSVTIKKIKKDSTIGHTIYKRVFKPSTTKEVRIYGMGGNDRFNISGTSNSPIYIHLIGAPGTDSYEVDSTTHNKKHLLIYDRSNEKNNFPAKSKARIYTAADTDITHYNRKNFQFDRFQTITYARYNPDYGIILTGGFAYTKQGFRKEPYSYHHELIGSYAMGRQSFLFNYKGEYIKLFSNNDLLINATSRGPHNISNFFGVGNNTTFSDEDDNINYFRTRYDLVYADIRLRHTYNNVKLSGGIIGQFYHSGAGGNENRLLGQYNLQQPTEDVFSNKSYAGLVTGLEVDTRDQQLATTHGVYFNTTISALQQLNQQHVRFGQINSELSLYANPDRDSIFVLAARFGGGVTVGQAGYFQQLKLGGADNLRGYRTWRFTGKSMVYNNLEARVKLFNFNSYLFPGSFGVTLFNDIGRVWSPGESSDKWHDGYGGGFFLIPAELLILQATLGHSKESNIVYVNVGYRF